MATPKRLSQSIKLEDNVPRVQPTPQSIDYEVAPQSNLLQYVDHAGYKTELGSEVEVSKDYCWCCKWAGHDMT